MAERVLYEEALAGDSGIALYTLRLSVEGAVARIEVNLSSSKQRFLGLNLHLEQLQNLESAVAVAIAALKEEAQEVSSSVVSRHKRPAC